jgi:hypothetical protein
MVGSLLFAGKKSDYRRANSLAHFILAGKFAG